MTKPTSSLTEESEKAILIQVIVGRDSLSVAEDSLIELAGLADTAGVTVVGSITQRRDRPTAQSFVGKGKLDEIRAACEESGADLVIVDHELTPVQVNNLDVALGVKVIDRTELILQIFARRAQSAEAQVQVELAQLQYLVSRIPVQAAQQRFKGGVGMKGPGESPFQLRAAPMRRRIADLKKKLEAIQKRRSLSRKRQNWPVVSLVGYTNAGKSTLLNLLTHTDDAMVDDRVFATLDTKTRKVRLPEGRDIMLHDTVGFIRSLPHSLVASFRSTLDVVNEADVLLLVANAGHDYVREHLDVVRETLKEIDAGDIPLVLVFNQCDTAASKAALPELLEDFPDAIPISARTQEGMGDLYERLQKVVPEFHK